MGQSRMHGTVAAETWIACLGTKQVFPSSCGTDVEKIVSRSAHLGMQQLFHSPHFSTR